MKVIKNYLYNASYQIFVLLIPLVTIPYLSRVLGPTGIGINSYTNSIVQYFIIFGSIGVNLYGNKQIAFVRDSGNDLSRNFYEIFFMRIITIFFSFVLFQIFLLSIHEYKNYYLAQSLSIIAAAFDISWFFMGIENFAVTVVRNFVVKIITLISIFIFVKSFDDLTIYILILSLSILFGNLTLFPSLYGRIQWPGWKSLNLWRHLVPSLILFIPQIATQIYLVLNKTMLGMMISVQSSGYFDQSDKIIKMVLAVVTASGTVMLPHVANAFSKGNKEKTKEYLYNSFSFVTAISIPMMLGLVAISPKFVFLFFTNKFIKVIPIMIIESVVILLIAWSNVIGTQYLLPTNQTKQYTLSVIIGAIVNLVANIPLIYMLGAIGASIATVLSELTVTSYQIIVIRKQVKYQKLFDDIFKYLASGCIMFLVVFYLDNKLEQNWSNLIIEIVIGMFVYIIMLLLFRVNIIFKLKRKLKKRNY